MSAVGGREVDSPFVHLNGGVFLARQNRAVARGLQRLLACRAGQQETPGPAPPVCVCVLPTQLPPPNRLAIAARNPRTGGSLCTPRADGLRWPGCCLIRDEKKELLLEEIRLLRTFDHPHIIKVSTAGRKAGGVCGGGRRGHCFHRWRVHSSLAPPSAHGHCLC